MFPRKFLPRRCHPSLASLRAFIDAWRTDDERQRRKLLEAAWADDGELVDPTGRFDGREAVTQLIRDPSLAARQHQG